MVLFSVQLSKEFKDLGACIWYPLFTALVSIYIPHARTRFSIVFGIHCSPNFPKIFSFLVAK